MNTRKIFRKIILKRRERHLTWLRQFHCSIKDILYHPTVQQMKDYPHHGRTNCYDHCRHVAYFNYKVDDIDKRQAVGGVMEALQAEASQGVAGKMDAMIAAQALNKLAKLHASSAVTLTKDNVLLEIDKALGMLYENDVSLESKIVVTVPPWMYILAKQAYVDLDTDNSQMLKNGRVGRYGNAVIKMSNNVAKTSGGESRVMVRTNKAIAFANPMTHVEPYRPEKGFSDAVKGFVLYDSKIVRPKELVVMNVKPG